VIASGEIVYRILIRIIKCPGIQPAVDSTPNGVVVCVVSIDMDALTGNWAWQLNL
jgi:hypothetical protein